MTTNRKKRRRDDNDDANGDDDQQSWVYEICDFVRATDTILIDATRNNRSRDVGKKGFVIESILPHVKKPVLRGQCQYNNRDTQQRCKFLTTYDYRYCTHHLMQTHGVVVAPSRISPNAGLGLFVVNRSIINASDTDPTETPHIRKDMVVVQRGKVVGETLTFVGEIINNAQYTSRWGDRFAEYVLGIDDHYSHDETRARTCLSYANDGINTRDSLLRRNYVHPHGTHVVWHDPMWPHVVNAACCDYPYKHCHSGTVLCLQAIGDISHGEEVLWSYSGTFKPSKNGRGVDQWTRWMKDDSICDAYWYGLLNENGNDGKPMAKKTKALRITESDSYSSVVGTSLSPTVGEDEEEEEEEEEFS